jgi:dTDP-4-dehydrorhamnose 3,5-epimerase
MFKNGEIQGVLVRPLVKYTDKRGWLIELFRQDELDPEYLPVMSYISMTEAGIARGPHEHVAQTDLFGFLGPSDFKVYLWDNRKDSPTYMHKQVIEAGEKNPAAVLVPPGVVHAYRNIGSILGMVTNYPNQLFAGKGRKEPVDEIRHENDPNTMYKLD